MVTVLDGGLATTLEAAGHDLSDELWSARLLRDEPAAIADVHRSFVAAGAQVVTTASYQASYAGFAHIGVGRAGTDVLLRRSVELARDAAAGRARVAASVGPYGAALADGSEYRGDYGRSVAELRRFHHDRLRVLADAGPDLLALETVPCLAEGEALLAELAGVGVPAWLSFTTCAGERLRSGEPAAEAFSLSRGITDLVAVGVNCASPADAGALVTVAAQESGLPVVVYPNSGERWDAAARAWTGTSRFEPADVRGWVRDGARLVGGCCRVGPADVAALAAAANGADG